MEPVTHILTGAVLARTGLNRRAAYTTAAMALAAEFPDIDFVWRAGGPLTYFEHHRGLTHTFLGLPFEAVFLTLLFAAYHHLRGRPATKAPVRWSLLFAFILLALLSHIFLDWTNNYGVRPFFPFNPHWYAGSFVFIFDPLLFTLLVLALILPALFGLINSEVGARKSPFPAPGWSFAALALCISLWTLRATQHARALTLAAQTPVTTPDNALDPSAEPASQLFASPYPADPFRWAVVEDTPSTYRLFTASTHGMGVLTDGRTLHKPSTTLPLLAAKRTPLGRIFLDWSMLPLLSEQTDTSDTHHPLSTITFSDVRFLYPSFLSRPDAPPPLSGAVTLDMQAPEGHRLVQQTLGGKAQR